MGADEALESELGLGELAGLTVANEADSLAYDVCSDFIFDVLTQLWKIKKDLIEKMAVVKGTYKGRLWFNFNCNL